MPRKAIGPTSKGRRSFLRSGPRLAFPFRRRIVISRKINLRASQSGFCQGNDECLAWISVTLIAWPTTACLTVRRLDTIISHPSVLDLPQAPAAALEAGPTACAATSAVTPLPPPMTVTLSPTGISDCRRPREFAHIPRCLREDEESGRLLGVAEFPLSRDRNTGILTGYSRK